MQRCTKNSVLGVRSDRWMISYADFLTLLFAVFVVFFMLERSGKYTPRQVFEAVAGARHAQSSLPPAPPQRAEPVLAAQLVPHWQKLVSELHDDIMEGKLEVRIEPRGIVISLGQAAFFQSGRAEIDPAGYPTIDRLAKVIGSLPNPIRLEGHTDNVRIRNSRFKSNWELSAARSIAMLELLATRDGVSRDRLSIAGFAETVPLTSNEDPEGRARNRRVEVIILSQGTGSEPATP
jgi:chemotaxis protein MotB